MPFDDMANTLQNFGKLVGIKNNNKSSLLQERYYETNTTSSPKEKANLFNDFSTVLSTKTHMNFQKLQHSIMICLSISR